MMGMLSSMLGGGGVGDNLVSGIDPKRDVRAVCAHTASVWAGGPEFRYGYRRRRRLG